MSYHFRDQEKIEPMSAVPVEGEEIPPDEHFVLWGDSDIPYLQQMYSEGEVSERFYDELGFPKDTDKKGNIWLLNSSADHLTRSKILYHPTVIKKRKD